MEKGLVKGPRRYIYISTFDTFYLGTSLLLPLLSINRVVLSVIGNKIYTSFRYFTIILASITILLD